MSTAQQITNNVDRIKELESLLAAQQAQFNALVASKVPSLGIKVSTKGAVSVYGLGRWPVTLYAGQWQALAKRMHDVEAFISANSGALAKKEG